MLTSQGVAGGIRSGLWMSAELRHHLANRADLDMVDVGGAAHAAGNPVSNHRRARHARDLLTDQAFER